MNMIAKSLAGLLGLMWVGLVLAATQQIGDVTLSTNAFDPQRGGKVVLSYRLADADKVNVNLYDPDGGLVRELLSGLALEAGAHSVEWDGRDLEGAVVPDEAYTFTIETASGSVYDPTTRRGGIVGDITEARFEADGTVTYRLPAASRVLIRLGLHSGPMLKTLADWRPRVAGTITEYWDGRDEDGLMTLRQEKGLSSLITYVTLPEATVITYGNTAESYRDYKLGRVKGRPNKPSRPWDASAEVQMRPALLVPPAWARAPRVGLSFPAAAPDESGALPVVKDVAQVRVDVDPADRELLEKEQFEIIFFVDKVFFAEAERGYLPMNWQWELHQLPPGEHILTVNVSSFKGQVGVASRKVKVVGPEKTSTQKVLGSP